MPAAGFAVLFVCAVVVVVVLRPVVVDLAVGVALEDVLAAGATLAAGLEAREAVFVAELVFRGVVAAEVGCGAGAGTETGRCPSISCKTAHATAPVVAAGGPYFSAFVLIKTLSGAWAKSDGNLEEEYVHPIMIGHFTSFR